MMQKWLFGWLNEIPGLTRKERDAYKAFHLFVIFSYVFWCRMALFPFLGSRALLFDRGVKLIFVVTFIMFLVRAVEAGALSMRWNPMFSTRAKYTIGFTVYALLLGFLYNRHWASYWSIISIGIYFVTMTFVIALGRGGDYFRCNWKLFLLFFYVTVVLMAATSGVHITRIDEANGIEREIDEFRGSTSLAYHFRGVLQFAVFFFLLACLWKKRLGVVYRGLMFLSIIPYAYFQIYVQKFRSHILLLGLALFFSAVYSMKTGKLKSLVIIAIVGIVGVFGYYSKNFSVARERVEEATIEAMETSNTRNKVVAAFLGERGAEFKCFWEMFPIYKKIFGGGAKGYFDATYWGRGEHWDGIHVGFFKMMLIGGVFLFLFYIGFFTKAFKRRTTALEKIDGMADSCKALVIIIFIKNWINPIITTDACFEHFITWLALGCVWSPPSRLLYFPMKLRAYWHE